MNEIDNEISRGCHIILETSANLKKEEKIVIVTDIHKLNIAISLAKSADSLGGKTIILIMMPELCMHREPPVTVADALKGSDIIILPLTRAITHSVAVREALKQGARAISLTGFIMEMLRGGAIEADFRAIEPICQKMANILTKGKRVLVTSPAGTKLEFDISGRTGNAMTGIAKKGKFTPFPNIEANIAPLEGTTQGKAVIDGSIPFIGIGIPKNPITLEIKDGFVIGIEGSEEADRFREHLKTFNDPKVYNIAEFGIGFNPKAKLRGIVVEDEGVLGTAHVAIGTSASLGGIVQASLHYDLIMRNVTIDIDGKVILSNGKFNL